MIDRPQLVRALSDRRLFTDWVIVEREIERAVIAPGVRRREKTTHWAMALHVDLPQGRGTAHVELGPLDGDLADIIDRAGVLASSAIGESWTSVPQAAPAKVDVVDPTLVKGDLVDVAAAIASSLPASVVASTIEIARTQHRVEAHSGLRTEWMSSRIRATALVASADRSLEISREARRLGDLGLLPAITAASADLALYAKATPIKGGRTTLVINTDALLHDGGYGMWSVFAHQADAELERQGLTRLRLTKPVAPGADTSSEPLYISSEGARPFGVRSAPIGDDGDAVREFAIVEGGVSVGLGLTPREAALRGKDPNGGIRNLKVGSGTWQRDRPAGRVVELRRLRSLAIDRYTGDATIEVALAVDGETPVTGGTIRLDLIAALAKARRSDAEPIVRGPYRGPDSVMIADVDVIA